MVYRHLYLPRPTTESQFWSRIEEMFEVARIDFATLRFETRDEAMGQKFRSSKTTDDFRLDSINLMRYRQTDDRENLEYFWELGKSLLKPVSGHIQKRQLSMDFVHDWGVLMFCHGFVAPSAFALGEDLGSQRAGKAGGEYVSNRSYRKRKWVSHLLYRQLKNGRARKQADGDVAAAINLLRRRVPLPAGFEDKWFDGILTQRGQLRPTYTQKGFPITDIENLCEEPVDDIPPTNILIPNT